LLEPNGPIPEPDSVNIKCIVEVKLTLFLMFPMKIVTLIANLNVNETSNNNLRK